MSDHMCNYAVGYSSQGKGEAALDLHSHFYGTNAPLRWAIEGGNSFCFRTDYTIGCIAIQP